MIYVRSKSCSRGKRHKTLKTTRSSLKGVVNLKRYHIGMRLRQIDRHMEPTVPLQREDYENFNGDDMHPMKNRAGSQKKWVLRYQGEKAIHEA